MTTSFVIHYLAWQAERGFKHQGKYSVIKLRGLHSDEHQSRFGGYWALREKVRAKFIRNSRTGPCCDQFTQRLSMPTGRR